MRFSQSYREVAGARQQPGKKAKLAKPRSFSTSSKQKALTSPFADQTGKPFFHFRSRTTNCFGGSNGFARNFSDLIAGQSNLATNRIQNLTKRRLKLSAHFTETIRCLNSRHFKQPRETQKTNRRLGRRISGLLQSHTSKTRRPHLALASRTLGMAA